MKIKTKFRLMYYPIAILIAPIFTVFLIFGLVANYIQDIYINYKEWCFEKCDWYIKDEYGHWIINPKVDEE